MTIKVAIFSDVILVSYYHSCKEEALIPHYLIDIIHKTIKPSHLEKLQTIQNINKLILIKQIIVSSTPFVLVETDFQKNCSWSFEWGTRASVKCKDSMYFLGM